MTQETNNDTFNQELDSFLTSNVSVDFKDLTPEQQQEQLKLGKEGLVEYHKGLKKLETLKQDSLKLLVTDPDKQYKLTDALTKTHGDILDIDNSEHDVSVGGLPDVIAYLHPIVEHKCNVQHDSTRYRDYYGKDYHYNHIEFITENRNQKIHTSGEIFDSYKTHPEQKRLVKGKHVNKRAMKKQKTVFQHLNTLVQAKGYDSLVKRMEAAEDRLNLVDRKLVMLGAENTLLKQEMCDVSKQVQLHLRRVRGIEIEQEQNSLDIEELKLATDVLKDVANMKKRRFYLTYKLLSKSNTNLTVDDFCKMFSVSRRTLQYWKKEFMFE